MVTASDAQALGTGSVEANLAGWSQMQFEDGSRVMAYNVRSLLQGEDAGEIGGPTDAGTSTDHPIEAGTGGRGSQPGHDRIQHPGGGTLTGQPRSAEARDRARPTAAPARSAPVIALSRGKWKQVILDYIADGSPRYGQLRREMGSITQRTLSRQLRESRPMI
jgi:hypothetical protein